MHCHSEESLLLAQREFIVDVYWVGRNDLPVTVLIAAELKEPPADNTLKDLVM